MNPDVFNMSINQTQQGVNIWLCGGGGEEGDVERRDSYLLSAGEQPASAELEPTGDSKVGRKD